MATTFELIAKTEVGSGGAANIEFTSIPATFTDLKVIWSVRAGADSAADISFNGSTANRSRKNIYGDGSGVGSQNATNFYLLGSVGRSDYTANTFSNVELYIPNYAGSNNKSFSADSLNENNSYEAYMSLTAGLWSNTNAITSITITPNAGSFVQYSTAYLYGIKNS